MDKGLISDVHNDQAKNQFGKNEWSGAVGDLGTMLPLAFGLVLFNEFPLARLLLFWGIIYLITGWYFKVPISVQPLKAMSVLAIAQGFSADFLSTTAVFFGILLIILVASGLIEKLERIFTPGVTIGIQVGIGFILAQKAILLVIEKGWLLHNESGDNLIVRFLVFALAITLLGLFRTVIKFPLVPVLVLVSVLVVLYLNSETVAPIDQPLVFLSFPSFEYFTQAVIVLIIPQLPLTLGNAIYSASNASKTLWKVQAEKVTPEKLATSIGVGNVFIGLMGGFPMCHGAGGMAAHHQFGGRTGGTTIILGSCLIILALIPASSMFVFLIPVPLLAGLLVFNSWQMVNFAFGVSDKIVLAVVLVTAVTSFVTRNLAVALLVGKLLELTLEKTIRIVKQAKEE